MLNKVDLTDQLFRIRHKELSSEEKLLQEANKLLKQNLYEDKHLLDKLTEYNKSFEELDEDHLDQKRIFYLSEIKELSIIYRLKFLDTKFYKIEIPYEAILKIKELNQLNRKEIKTFKILAPPSNFLYKNSEPSSMLFAKTNTENYYLIHKWGKGLSWFRKFLYLPLRNFNTLVFAICLSTLILDLIIPTRFITLDHKADYFSGYRAAAFFHLLIFNFGVTIYFTFTFAQNFSSVTWNKYKDFD